MPRIDIHALSRRIALHGSIDSDIECKIDVITFKLQAARITLPPSGATHSTRVQVQRWMFTRLLAKKGPQDSDMLLGEHLHSVLPARLLMRIYLLTIAKEWIILRLEEFWQSILKSRHTCQSGGAKDSLARSSWSLQEAA